MIPPIGPFASCNAHSPMSGSERVETHSHSRDGVCVLVRQGEEYSTGVFWDRRGPGRLGDLASGDGDLQTDWTERSLVQLVSSLGELGEDRAVHKALRSRTRQYLNVGWVVVVPIGVGVRVQSRV